MDLGQKSFIAQTAVYGLLPVALIMWAAVRFGSKRWDSAKPGEDGHFAWAQAEMEQIAAERNRERHEDDAKLAAAILRADLEVEVGRIIAELPDDRRGGPKVSVGETFARGVGVIRSYVLMRQLLTDLERFEPIDGWQDPGSRFLQLRRVMELDETPLAPGGGGALLQTRARR